MIYDLPEEDRPSPSARQLDQWVRDARELTGGAEQRIGWVLSSTIVIAALQRVLDANQCPLFLIKGGLYLELQLGLGARTTKDVDMLFRGTAEDFEIALKRALTEPWGPFLLQATALKRVEKAQRLTKPYRFDIKLVTKGATWRRVRIEVSFPEGHIAEHATLIPTPRMTSFFGVESPEEIIGITMDYQVAQKTHASTDPDIPPDIVNDRVRDIVDLVLIKENFYTNDDSPSSMLKAACLDVFNARAEEAVAIGAPPRPWPPTFVANARWAEAYPGLAESVGMTHTLAEAIAIVQGWIDAIDAEP
ncbi:MAG: nucleotidyl transferase AbiEii/AbiGii toxin family protein [Propionibacteriaceae bacterium]|jgi:hypothetical protein|nr:nucleotidyl transferase AbiEii/AbiGii toxin family protein [Propionibacteriaceae bacterium]